MAEIHRLQFPDLEFDLEGECAAFQEMAEKIRPLVRDTFVEMQKAFKGGKRILVEGANATMLDIDFGTYPYVTSSRWAARRLFWPQNSGNRHAPSPPLFLVFIYSSLPFVSLSAALWAAPAPVLVSLPTPLATSSVLSRPTPPGLETAAFLQSSSMSVAGVVTRTCHPRQTQHLTCASPLLPLSQEIGDELQKKGVEVGTTTGRPRRCGWLDTVVVDYACQLNGVTR